MYLKRVEIFGFKSFADRTEFEFVPGVTAIVGPNGSGKSNIAEAIRWVLGEQSVKSLRGSRMEDVIFAGSDSRKPLNYGEVSLTLDNSDSLFSLDFSEITVTRRFYRSGESEYFINKKPCRLKDITELFMDTGIGREAYSIIGQGKVEEILSSKAEDRRGIFEDAAGIVKYKVRKREAQKKLEETEANLVRILDIIREIEEQMEPLEEQARTARIYKELKQALRNKEVGLYVYNIEQIHGKWEESKKRIELLAEKQLQLSGRVNRHDARIEKMRWRLNQLDQELEKEQERLLQSVEQLEKLEGQLNVLKERKRNANGNRQAFAEKMERLARKKEALLQEIRREEEERSGLQAKLDALLRELRSEEEKWEGIGRHLASDLEQLKSDYIALLGELADARNERKTAAQKKTLAFQKLERLQEERKRQKTRVEELQGECGGREERLKAVRAEMEVSQEAFRRESRELERMEEEGKKLAGELQRHLQLKDQLGSRLEVMKEMQQDFSGFMQGVREVLKARDSRLQGIHGAVAELITVPKEYEIAVEIALGSALQHVVVDDEKAGREAILFLKRNNLGRATFLPISVMKGRKPSFQDEQVIRRQSGVYGFASELISFAETYRGVIEYLLGTVVIADTLETANRVARLTGYRLRIVTLDGDVVNPGGSMTGGAVTQKSSHLLGRNRLIEELEGKWKEALADCQVLEQKLGEWQKRKLSVQRNLELLKEKEESLRQKEQELATELALLRTEAKNEEKRLALIEQEISLCQEELREAEQAFRAMEGRVQSLENEEESLKQAIELADRTKKEQESSREEMASRITHLKVTAAQTGQMLDNKDEAIERLRQELVEVEREREQLDQELKQLLTMLEENDRFEEELQSGIERCKAEKAELSRRIEEKKGIRLRTQEEMEAEENGTRELRRSLKQVEDELHREEVKANRYEVELDNLLQKLREEYELTYEAAKAGFPVPADGEVGQVRTEVFRLKREIASLGEVNLGAIEEYERLRERYQFLTSQSEDLKNAKDTLYQVIDEIDTEMASRFQDAFEQIRHQFQIVFSQLFGGGRADLILTAPGNVLETGVEIMAQPPGKKLQNLMLLSGGEKALTAIALLFAILKVRPVPFCVLDEVEAALDEANVARFARYLKEFSRQTQFIVITHRKGTMEEADVLYGVTMEDSGVSKLVSVRLEDYDEAKGATKAG